MTNQHLITPPPELQEEWLGLWPQDALLQAARWGADVELDACCEFENKCYGEDYAAKLRRHRRPKPKSLVEEALEALKHAEEGWRPVPADCDIIRRALERLQELER